MYAEIIYKILLSFDDIYDKMDDGEKQELIKCMIKKELYLPEEQNEQRHVVKSRCTHF